MASQYDQGLHDQHASSYASLPGTSQAGFVTHNMTPMKSNLAPGREIAGCSPSRWIYELINNDFTVCDMFERYRHAKPESRYTWDHPHKLVINGNQSFSTDSSRVLSSICLDCNFHFVFKMTWDKAHVDCLCSPNQSSWPLCDNQFPWHHLVWAGSSSDPDVVQDHTRYYPLLAREHFVCSAPPCTFQLTLEVSEPRMPPAWVSLLLDREAICEQLRIAKEQEPTRYEGATDEWAYQATLNLNTYLKNLLESKPEDARSISKRNKRFAVLFGPRCFSMFRDLGFAEKVDIRDDVDEGSFTPSPPPPAGGPSGATEISTYRSYLEDVRAEVQCLIHKAGQAAERPTFCTPVLHTDLGCEEIPNIAGNALINVERYKVLGVLPNQTREAVVNAYKRQWELLPSRRRALVDAIMGVANDTGDELLSDYAITQSSVFDNQTGHGGAGDDDGLVTQALNFLGLQPPNNHSAESLLRAFRQKIAQNPADASTARSMLLLIAQNSTDDMYQAKILMEADAKMSLETSRFILGLSNTEVPWQTSIEATKQKLNESKSKEATALYLDATDAIADHTYSAALKQAVMELRQTNGMFGFKDSASEANKPVDYALPVGLHNIGNTCYLNSLLQYLFTVKPIRDIVLNYEDVRLDLTEENIKARLLGGNKMQMDRGEAVVAQAFAKELAVLFRNLESSNQAATKPSQRLANAVLLSTHTLLHTPKQSSDSPAGSNPPPLPARPSPAPPTKTTEDVDMANVTVTSLPESTDVASNSSSRTLVDQEDAASDRSFEKIDVAPSNAQANTVSEVLPDDTTMTEAGQAAHPPQSTEQPVNAEAGSEAVAEASATRDVDMADAAEPETVDQKVLNALEHQKRSSGTDQQDVEEVMGSIINRLQAAIRPSSIDEKTGIQLEKIMETFFVTTVNYTKKFDDKKYQNEISFDRSITAFPAPDGPCSLYDALGRNFDQQILEESKLSRYTAIKTLPPVLHILIQRTQSVGSKNGNPVVIPETLYLDRYMDAPHDSHIFKRRVEDWAITDRISDIKAQLAKVESNPTYLSYLQNYADGKLGDDTTDAAPVNGDACELISAPEENWDFDGPVEDDFLIVTPSDSTVSGPAAQEPVDLDIRGTHKAIVESMERELHAREQALEKHREGMKEIPYRLHAVICHRGQLMSGHYWVWIHDFEENTWRWYNDADVKVNKDTAEVLQTLSTSGEPYYLCYVRDEDKTMYVDVPKRHPPTPPAEEEPTPPAAAAEMTTDGDGDVDIDTATETTPPAAPIEMVEVSKVRSRQGSTEPQESVTMQE